MSDESVSNRQNVGGRNAWAWPITWIAIVLILVVGAVYVFRSCLSAPGQAMDKAGRMAEKIGTQMARVAAAFIQGTITTTFTSYATTLSGSQYLQFATLKQHERFTRKDEATTAFGYIPLPDVIVEAEAPVTYTYYLDLNEKWDFVLQNGSITVTAPDIRFNKPAVDVSRITYEVKKDSLIRDTRQAKEGLKDSITWMSLEKAKSNIELVRETGRRQTEMFVHNWLAKSFADGTNYPVTVRFRSEVQNKGAELPPKDR